MEAEQELSRCVSQLVLARPFFGHLLAGVPRVIDESTPSAGVALTPDGVRLRVNPDYFMTLTPSERIGAVQHEALHLLFKHPFRFDPRVHRRDVYDVAADLVVNQWVEFKAQSVVCTLPPDAITLDWFEEPALRKDQTVQWYYDALLAEEARQQQASSGTEVSQGAASEGDDPEAEGDAAGGPENDDADTERDAAGDGDGDDGVGIPSAFHGDHGAWGGDQTEGMSVAMEGALDNLILSAKDRCSSRSWSAMPGPLRALVQAILKRRAPQVDWRRALRIFAASSERTRIVATQRRESKRYAEFAGWIRRSKERPEHRDHMQRRIVQGIQVKRFQKLLVALDTSGSVDDQALSLLFSEVHGMWRWGAEITVVECDAAVRRVWDYRGKLPGDISGRGGTAFDPVFRWMREQNTQYNGVIYLTDGYAQAPTVKPPAKLVWVITPEGDTGEHLLWGRVIRLSA